MRLVLWTILAASLAALVPALAEEPTKTTGQSGPTTETRYEMEYRYQQAPEGDFRVTGQGTATTVTPSVQDSGQDSGVEATAGIVQKTQPGPRGPQGYRGQRGYHGKGIQGPPGQSGLQGPPGKDGRDGQDGKDGDHGPRGPQGQPGRLKEWIAPFVALLLVVAALTAASYYASR